MATDTTVTAHRVVPREGGKRKGRECGKGQEESEWGENGKEERKEK